jgi:uncharacterized protein YajQ (UPF0234 family)
MPSFDVVSKLDWAEVANAMNQAQKELSQRFDFKGTDAKLERTENVIWVHANADDRVRAAWDVFQEKLIRRKVSLKHFEPAKDPEKGPKGGSKLKISVKEGVDQDHAREIVKRIKDMKFKVQASIAGDTVRVSGKKRDDLQEVIADLKGADLELDLQFINFRD